MFQYQGMGSPRTQEEQNLSIARNNKARIQQLETVDDQRRRKEHLKKMQGNTVADYMQNDFNPFNTVARTQPEGSDYLSLLKNSLDKMRQLSTNRPVVYNPFR